MYVLFVFTFVFDSVRASNILLLITEQPVIFDDINLMNPGSSSSRFGTCAFKVWKLLIASAASCIAFLIFSFARFSTLTARILKSLSV